MFRVEFLMPYGAFSRLPLSPFDVIFAAQKLCLELRALRRRSLGEEAWRANPERRRFGRV